MSKQIGKILKEKSGESAVMAIDQLLSEIYDKSRAELSKAELNFMLIEELEREINSGGFNNYFYNSYGNYAMETIEALDVIGALKFKAILNEALTVFGDEYLLDEIERSDLIDDNEDDYDEVWEELDDKFYEYPENIHQLLIDYIHKNIDDFR